MIPMNKRRDQPKSPFATVLSLLIDGAGLCGRKQWAEILGVSTAAISQWLNDHTLPLPEHLRMVLATVRQDRKRIDPNVIDAFEQMAALPAMSVSPFFNRIGDSVSAYMIRPLLDGFLRDLRRLKPEVQERLLLRFNESCMEEAGVFSSDPEDPSEVELVRDCVASSWAESVDSSTLSATRASDSTLSDEDALLAVSKISRILSGVDACHLRTTLQRLAHTSRQRTALEDKFTRLLRDTVGQTEQVAFGERRREELYRRLEVEYRGADQWLLKNWLSWLVIEMKRARPAKSELSEWSTLCRVLAEAFVRFGTDSRIAYQLVRETPTPAIEDDPVTFYNCINLCLLNGDSERAERSWQQLVRPSEAREDNHFIASRIIGYDASIDSLGETLVISGDCSELSVHHLLELRSSVGIEGHFSFVGAQPIDILDLSPYVLRATLAGWCSDAKHGFLVSSNIRANLPELFAYGPRLEDSLTMPGMPLVRLATALVRLGVRTGDAWKFASFVRESYLLILVHSNEKWDKSATDRIGRVLPRSFSISRSNYPGQSQTEDLGAVAQARGAATV